jgi:hypothetical protein
MSGARETRPRPREPAPPHALKEGGDLQGTGHQGRERSSMPEVADSAHTERGFGAVGEENKRERKETRDERGVRGNWTLRVDMFVLIRHGVVAPLVPTRR